MATFQLYASFKQRMLDENVSIPLASGTPKVILTTSSYVPNATAHATLANVTNELSTGNGYTAGGIALTSKVVGYDTNNNFSYFDADDAVWTNASFTARRAVLFLWNGGSTSPLIGWVDFGADTAATNGIFAIRWASPAAGGILRLK